MPFSIEGALAASALTTGTLSILAYLLYPRWKENVWLLLETDLIRFDKIRKKAIDADPVYARNFVREILSTELAILHSVNQQCGGHHDSLEFLRASITAMSQEMRQLPSLAEAMKQNAKAFADVADALRGIHVEISDHSKQLAKWDGFMAGMEGKWAGNERRVDIRRDEDRDKR